jgi:PAS domain S-box-containing protein
MKLENALERALHVSQRFLIVKTDLEGNYTYVNPLFQKRFQFIAKDFIGLPFQVTIHPDDVEPTNTLVHQVIASPGTVFPIYIRKPNPDGSYFENYWEFSAVVNTKGEPEEILCVGFDVTEINEAQEKIRELANFQGLLTSLATEFINIPVDSIDQKLQYLLERVGKYTQADRVSLHEVDMVRDRIICQQEWCAPGVGPTPEEFREIPLLEGDTDDFAKRLLQGKTIQIPDFDALDRDSPVKQLGQFLGVRASVYLPVMDGETCLAFVGLNMARTPRTWTEQELATLNVLAEILTNIFLKKRSEALRRSKEQEIRELNKTLEQRVEERTAELKLANEDLEHFSYSVSHDLKSPVRRIKSFLQLLQRQLPPDVDAKVLHFASRIQEASEDIEGIIYSFLRIAQLGRSEIQKKRVDANELIREVLASFQLEIKAQQTTIEMGRLPQIYADPTLMKMVFSNLISNALKYARPDVPLEIKIRATEQEDATVISITDNGIGFVNDQAEKVFQLFERLDAAQQHEGSGIGLANVKRIVIRHGGRIWAKSQPQQGATFFVGLPKFKN